jgi:hypothetical protein
MKTKLQYLDKTLGYLVDKLQENHLTEAMNVIITSDHGMEAIKENPKISLEDYVDVNLFDLYGSYCKWDLFLKNSTYFMYILICCDFAYFSIFSFLKCQIKI